MSGVGAYLSPVHTGCATPCHAMPFPVPHSLCATPRHSLCPIPCRAGRSGIATGACPDISAPRCQFYTRPRVTPGWPRSCSLVTCPLPPSLSLVPLPIPILCPRLPEVAPRPRHPRPRCLIRPATPFGVPVPPVPPHPAPPGQDTAPPPPPGPERADPLLEPPEQHRHRHRQTPTDPDTAGTGVGRAAAGCDNTGTDRHRQTPAPTPIPAPPVGAGSSGGDVGGFGGCWYRGPGAAGWGSGGVCTPVTGYR